jgi:hypothetical protein
VASLRHIREHKRCRLRCDATLTTDGCPHRNTAGYHASEKVKEKMRADCSDIAA